MIQHEPDVLAPSERSLVEPGDEQAAALPATLTAALEAHFGLPGFRGGQQAVIERVLTGRSTLALMPTGAGKSLCYQLPALLLPHATVVISPLIALMKDQLDGLPPEVRRRSTVINSSIPFGEVQMRLRDIAAGRFKLVYVAPERFRNRQFLHALQQASISLFVVDEAHCVSLWGMSFRPDYLFIGEALRELGHPPVLALTATATPATEREICAQLGELEPVRTNVFRPNLSFEVVKVTSNDAKHQQALKLCKSINGSLIIYVRSRAGCDEMADALRREGVSAEAYHAQRDDRDGIQERFMRGETRVIAATVAFGMGVDKSDIRGVIHFNLPQSLEAYAQEAGRSGRDGQPARCILMYMPSDKQQLSTWLQREEFTRTELRDIFRAVKRMIRGNQGLLSAADLLATTGLEETRLRVALGMLERVGLLRRHFDLPRVAALRLPAGQHRPSPEADLVSQLLELAEYPCEWTAHALAEQLGLPLSQIEAALLGWVRAGHLHYDGHGREMLLELLDPPPDTAERIDGILSDYRQAQEQRIASLIEYARSTNCRHRELAAHFGQRLQPCSEACDNCKSGRRPTTAPPTIRRGAPPTIPPRAVPVGLPDHHQLIVEAVRGHPAAWSSRDLAHMLVGSRGYSHAPIFGAMAHRSFDSIRAEIDVLVDAGQLAYRGNVLVAVERLPLGASAAQAILQALSRLPFAMGRTGLAKVLKGAASAAIGPERSPDHGALRHLTIEELERQIEALVQTGLIERDNTQQRFPIIRLSVAGRQALADPAQIPALNSGSSARSSAPALSEPDQALVERLKTWRAAQADELQQPHFFIFSNAVLFDIAARQPMTLAELAAIKGIGTRKLEAWGEELLRIVGEAGSA